MLLTVIVTYLVLGVLITMTLGDVFSSVYVDWQTLWFDVLLFIFSVIASPLLSLIFIIQGVVEKLNGRL
jgi:magnesium-transporting ATPase (P-type)